MRRLTINLEDVIEIYRIQTDKNQTVFMKCSKEKSLLISAFIEVAFKFLLYLYKVRNLLEKKYSEMFDKNPDEI